jgi:acetyl esterase
LSGYDKSETPLYAAPGFGELQALPPSYVETAEFDPLKDEGLNYVRGLQAQSIEVTVNETQQTIHGYDGNTKSEIAKKSMLQRIAFLKTTFGFADSPTD